MDEFIKDMLLAISVTMLAILLSGAVQWLRG